METKICSKCKHDLPITMFPFRGGGKRHGQCKECRKAAIKAHYERNRSAMIAKARRYAKQAKKLLVERVNMIKSVPCTDCKASYPPYVMTFDHLPQFRKLGNVSDLVRQGRTKLAMKEIEKCEVVCQNCQSERTHRRKAALSSK